MTPLWIIFLPQCGKSARAVDCGVQLLRGYDESESVTIMSNWLTTAQTPRLHHVSQIRPNLTMECQQIGTKTTRLPPPPTTPMQVENNVVSLNRTRKMSAPMHEWCFQAAHNVRLLVTIAAYCQPGRKRRLWRTPKSWVRNFTNSYLPQPAGSMSWSRSDFLNSLLLSHCDAKSSCDTSLYIDKFFCHTNDFLFFSILSV